MARLKAADREHICVLDANNHHDPLLFSRITSFRYMYETAVGHVARFNTCIVVRICGARRRTQPSALQSLYRGVCLETLYFDDDERCSSFAAMLLSDVSADKPPVGRHDAENEAIGLAFFKKSKMLWPSSERHAAKVQSRVPQRRQGGACCESASPSVSLPPSGCSFDSSTCALVFRLCLPRAVEKSASSPPTPQVSPPPRAPRPCAHPAYVHRRFAGGASRKFEAEAKEVAVAVEERRRAVAATAAEAKVAVEAAAAPKSFRATLVRLDIHVGLPRSPHHACMPWSDVMDGLGGA